MQLSKIMIAGLILLASASASAGCVVIDDAGTILCSADATATTATVQDAATPPVLLPRYELKNREFDDKRETIKCGK